MKKSIKHLPKCTQEEINTIQELVIKTLRKCEMIIVFGSYARKKYVLYEESIKFGIRSIYQSDIDILVVTSGGGRPTMLENRLNNILMRQYEKRLYHRKRYAIPQFVVVDIKELNKNLKRTQYFYTDIIKQGIKIYDTENFELAKPQELSWKEIHKYALNEFNIFYPKAERFILHASKDLIDEEYIFGSFLLHQACERLLNTISLVFTNYRPMTHKLDELIGKAKEFSREINDVFPKNAEFEIRCFDLLKRAYVEARYNSGFEVTKEEYEYMLAKVELLKDVTKRICEEQLNYYETQKK